MGGLFGTSGVRGRFEEQITPQLAIDLGLSLAELLGNSGAVVIGKDPRTSSDMLEGCLISGLLSGGCGVKRLGTVPTPVVGFAARAERAGAGLMITASHNPAEYNGVKFFDSSGMAYTSTLEGKIERAYFRKKWGRVAWDKVGDVEEVDVVPDYIEAVAGAVQPSRGYKVVVDCGNGAASAAAPELLRELGCKVTSLNCQPDGFFPGRPLEPSPENLGELCKLVRSTEADIGIAHDGDADRVVAVGDDGAVASGDELLALVAASRVSRGRDVVVTTVDASRVVEELVGGRGGQVVLTRVGDVSVAAEIKRRKAAFGGEPCGAWIFPDFGMAPDGLLGAATIIELMSSSGKSLSELLEPLPDYFISRMKVACPDQSKARIMGAALKRLQGEFPEAVGSLNVDGVRLNLEDGWVLVRASGTEPIIRVTAEGRTPGRAGEIARKSVRVLRKAAKGAR